MISSNNEIQGKGASYTTTTRKKEARERWTSKNTFSVFDSLSEDGKLAFPRDLGPSSWWETDGIEGGCSLVLFGSP